MKNIKETIKKEGRAVRVLQFGEGNFLRAFADYLIDRANRSGVYNGSVAVVQPINVPLMKFFSEQDSIYTVLLRGKEDGATVDEPYVVSSVSEVISAYADYERFMAYASLDTLEAVISNTTEAGIVFDAGDSFEAAPPATYPGKLTKFLYARYKAFGGDMSKGLVIFPVELIENNGGKLKECVLKLCEAWKLEDGFVSWVNEACMFTSTLVDRIVTGYPRKAGEADSICEKLGYSDNLLDICEPFALWVIEASDTDRARRVLPLDTAGLPVVFTNDQKPYRERKVRILNGAHTSFVPAAFLAGQDIVRDCMADDVIRPFIDRCIYGEIMPTLTLPKDDVMAFADSVCERFENPFIDHELISICLNSVSKWKARVLPSVLDSFNANGKLPSCLTMSFASLCEFYSRGKLTDEGFFGTRQRNGETVSYKISDDKAVIDFFAENGEKDNIIELFAANESFWGQDLTKIQGFVETADKMLTLIRKEGTAAAMKAAVKASV
ncbi:MAG: tagaturonate reductase [Clostridia bacterium]|nr:tagaturonate reductase [Clostridia bacterium]